MAPTDPPAVARTAEQARARFARHFGYESNSAVAFAPGRVNLIGEHTDYNEGFVFPIGLEHGVAIAFGTLADKRPGTTGEAILRAHSPRDPRSHQVRLGNFGPRDAIGWFAYVAGVAWALNRAGRGLNGVDLQTSSNLPAGAGLSSSAALELAVARALVEAEGGSWAPIEMAKLCRVAENEFVGVPCGIMDQFAAAASEVGCATLLDCRSLQGELVPIPGDAVIVVMNTGVRRNLASSAYADRRAACEAAVRVFHAMDSSVTALRDVDAGMLQAAAGRLDPITARRAAHVVHENERVLAAKSALLAHDLERVGALMNESHESLRDLYEVSGPELDLAVTIARRHRACWGARMTGAGFGGCAIALVRAEGVEDFISEARTEFARDVRGAGEYFACRPAAGARLV